MGRFATGVTVVTTTHRDTIHGMTANAFLSVSLRPPLVLVSLGRCRMSEMLPRTGRYGVSVLASRPGAASPRTSPVSASPPIAPEFVWDDGLPAARRRAGPRRLPRRRRPPRRRPRAVDRRGRAPAPRRRAARTTASGPCARSERRGLTAGERPSGLAVSGDPDQAVGSRRTRRRPRPPPADRSGRGRARAGPPRSRELEQRRTAAGS